MILVLCSSTKKSLILSNLHFRQNTSSSFASPTKYLHSGVSLLKESVFLNDLLRE